MLVTGQGARTGLAVWHLGETERQLTGKIPSAKTAAQYVTQLGLWSKAAANCSQ